MGGERDLSITAHNSSSDQPNLDLAISGGVEDGSCSGRTSNNITASLLLQWDGPDNSMKLNPSGLGEIDFTQQGGAGLRVNVESNAQSLIIFSLYSGSLNEICTMKLTLLGDKRTYEYILYYSFFIGNCDFTKIGAVEANFVFNSSLTETFSEIKMETLSIYGIPSTSPTPSPSRFPSFYTLFYIDDFYIVTQTIAIIVPNNMTFPISKFSSIIGPTNDIIGQERDLSLTVNSGTPNLVVSSGVANNAFTCVTPSGVSSSSLIQWDGVDHSQFKSNWLGRN